MDIAMIVVTIVVVSCSGGGVGTGVLLAWVVLYL